MHMHDCFVYNFREYYIYVAKNKRAHVIDLYNLICIFFSLIFCFFFNFYHVYFFLFRQLLLDAYTFTDKLLMTSLPSNVDILFKYILYNIFGNSANSRNCLPLRLNVVHIEMRRRLYYI